MANHCVKLRYSNPCHLLALGFGAGLSPVMPGTVGTLVALPCWWLLAKCAWPFYVMLLLIAVVAGIYVCGRTARDLGLADPKIVVWDEFVGLWITLIALPAYQWQWIMAGFMLFRLLDIAKPWPISWIDRHIRGGLGIMLDDMVAGGLAACALWVCGRYWLVMF